MRIKLFAMMITMTQHLFTFSYHVNQYLHKPQYVHTYEIVVRQADKQNLLPLVSIQTRGAH